MLHGHQKKMLAMFVLGAIKAESVVVQVEDTWEQFLEQVLPFWRNQPVTLILDLTPFEEAWFVISDRPADSLRIQQYGWQWESSHVRQRDRLERLLLVLFLAFWWLMHLAASCIYRGRRSRYDRHDRRAKGMLHLGRLYLRDIDRGGYDGALCQSLLLRRHQQQWRFSLRF